jgi:hypothetical protein
MARTITAAVDTARTAELIARLRQMDDVLSIQLHRQASVKDVGDVLVVTVTNRMVPRVMDILGEEYALRPTSLTISEPDAFYSKSAQSRVIYDDIESPWEESHEFLRRTSQLNLNFLLLMVLSGGLITAGLSLANLPLIIGALLIVPAFEPFIYVGWGIALRNRRVLRDGIRSLLIGYLVLAIAAALAFLLLRQSAQASLARILAFPLTSYWISFGLPTVVVPVLAAAAGAIVVATHRSVLTSGITIILALVPTAALIGIGLLTAQWELALRALAKWAIEASITVLVGAMVFALKNRFWFHRRMSWF